MDDIIDQLSQMYVTVKNKNGAEDDPENAIEWYFKDSSIYRKKYYNQKHPIMVGAHVEILDIELFKGYSYIIPLCEECNNKKENLQPFKIQLGYLKLAPHST